MARYHLVTDWLIDAPIDRVWDVLLLVRDWPAWWKGFRSVEVLDSGADSGLGMKIRQRWRSLLPYTLVLDLEIARVERHRALEGRSSGDMAGACRWTFLAQDDGTRVRFEMDVRPTRWWMNLPIPLAGRVVAWNYDAIMRWGADGIARRLAVDVAELPALTEAARA